MPKATHPSFCTRDHAPGQPHTSTLEHFRVSHGGHEAIITLQRWQRAGGRAELCVDVITEPGLLTADERRAVAHAAGTALLTART